MAQILPTPSVGGYVELDDYNGAGLDGGPDTNVGGYVELDNYNGSNLDGGPDTNVGSYLKLNRYAFTRPAYRNIGLVRGARG